MKRKLLSMILLTLIVGVLVMSFASCSFLVKLEEEYERSHEELSEENQTMLDVLRDGASNYSQSSYIVMNSNFGTQEITTEYKQTETGFFQASRSTAIGNGSTQKSYCEKEGADYYFYSLSEGEWSKVLTNEETALKSRAAMRLSVRQGLDDNLFDPSNYEKDGDHFRYIGPTVALTVFGVRVDMTVQGLYVDDTSCELRATAGAGSTQITYRVFDVGNTVIDYPTVGRSEGA